MTSIRAVIFDLGGVLINLAPERTRAAFGQLGIGDFERLFTVFHAMPLFDQLETGHVSPTEFIEALKKELPPGVSDSDIIGAWNAMLLDFRIQSLRFVESLNARLPVFLYSNTNLIHYGSFQQSLRETTPFSSLDALFRKAYYSHEIGHRKPDPGGYLHIIQEQSLDAKETLFVDDNARNIEGAGAVGLKTILLQAGETVEERLSDLLNP